MYREVTCPDTWRIPMAGGRSPAACSKCQTQLIGPLVLPDRGCRFISSGKQSKIWQRQSSLTRECTHELERRTGRGWAGLGWCQAAWPTAHHSSPVGPRSTPRHHRHFQPAAQGRRAAAAAARRRWCPRWPRKHSKVDSKVLLYCRDWSTPHLRHPGQPEAKHFANELQDVLQLPKQHMR